MKKNIKQGIFQIVLILVVGSIGGAFVERYVFPSLANVPVLKVLAINPRAPVVITTRQEVQINSGINNADVANSVKGTLVTAYVYENDFTSPRFRLLATVTGAIVTSDGIIAIPFLNWKTGTKISVILSDQSVYPATLLAVDPFTGIAFLRIAKSNLPVIRQGLSQDIQPGEPALLLWNNDSPSSLSLSQILVSSPSAALPSLAKVYDFSHLNAFVRMDTQLAADQLGGVLVDRDGTLLGMVTQQGKDLSILRSEDLKLVIDNYLNDQRIVWPSLKITYQVLSAGQAALLKLPKQDGILVKSGNGVLLAGDYVVTVDGQALTGNNGFQQLLLLKLPGDAVPLTVFRNGAMRQVGITL